MIRKKRVSSEFCQSRFGRSLGVAVATLEDTSNYTNSPLFVAGFVGRAGGLDPHPSSSTLILPGIQLSDVDAEQRNPFPTSMQDDAGAAEAEPMTCCTVAFGRPAVCRALRRRCRGVPTVPPSTVSGGPTSSSFIRPRRGSEFRGRRKKLDPRHPGASVHVQRLGRE